MFTGSEICCLDKDQKIHLILLTKKYMYVLYLNIGKSIFYKIYFKDSFFEENYFLCDKVVNM